MKKAKVLILCLGFIVLFASSQAMAVDLYGFGSYWDKEDVDGTWGGGAGLSLGLFTDYLRLDGRAYFFENSDLGTDELELLPFDVGVQVHLLPDGKLDPYFLGGVSYVYADSEAVVGPLALHPEPHSYDLCPHHATRLTVPQGWRVVRYRPEPDPF